MTSEKFSELADDIAERAANKMKTVDSRNLTTLRHSYDVDSYKNKQKIEKQTYARVDSKFGKKKALENNGKKFGEINTKAFLKPDVASQELSLNYKYMTKKLESNTDKNADLKDELESNAGKHEKYDKLPKRSKNKYIERGDSKLSDSSKEGRSESKLNYHSKENVKHGSKEATYNYSSKEHMKDRSEERKNIKMKSSIQNNSKEHHSSSDKYLTRNKNKNIDSNRNSAVENLIIKRNESKHEYSEETDRSQEKIQDSPVKSEKKPEMNSQPINEIEDSSSDTSNDVAKDTKVDVKKESQENKSHRLSSKEIVEVGIQHRAFSDDSSESHGEKLEIFDKSDDKYKKLEPIMKRQVVRRENGKLYTYISSPDYEEYHENVARVKSKNSFINTYK